MSLLLPTVFFSSPLDTSKTEYFSHLILYIFRDEWYLYSVVKVTIRGWWKTVEVIPLILTLMLNMNVIIYIQMNAFIITIGT